MDDFDLPDAFIGPLTWCVIEAAQGYVAGLRQVPWSPGAVAPLPAVIDVRVVAREMGAPPSGVTGPALHSLMLALSEELSRLGGLRRGALMPRLRTSAGLECGICDTVTAEDATDCHGCGRSFRVRSRRAA